MSHQEKNAPTLHAFNILQKTNNSVISLLKEMSANDAGYLTFSQIIEQIQSDISDAKARATAETIRIGLLGGRGSGKSTLANALIGKYILPESAIVFCTSIPTTIKYGPSYRLDIDSSIDSNIIKSDVNDSDAMQEVLFGICKESENPNNVKQITKISIDIPQKMLHGKEIVDVPGFTKGNALHQAFAEKYARYYCDLCLVLLNNAESVDINGEGGLSALCNAFKDRIESTIFIINKADQSSKGDLNYVKNVIRRNLDGKDFSLFIVSSKNTLDHKQEQFDFHDLREHVAYISDKKIVFMVLSLLQRLSSNFKTLRDLCHLSASTLNSMNTEINKILLDDFKILEKSLRGNISKKSIIPEKLPELDLSLFNIPSALEAHGPYNYAKKILESLGTSGIEILDNHIQNQQAALFKSFSIQFDEQIAFFDSSLKEKVHQFEQKFNVKTSITPPNIVNKFKVTTFNPSKIEKLRPTSFRLWAEKSLPSILIRDINFWKSPIKLTLPIGLEIGFTIPIPIGFRKKIDSIDNISATVPEKAIGIMNEYMIEAVSKFVRELLSTYENALTAYFSEWKLCLNDYKNRVTLAKSLTEFDSMKKLDELSKSLDESLSEINGLVVIHPKGLN